MMVQQLTICLQKRRFFIHPNRIERDFIRFRDIQSEDFFRGFYQIYKKASTKMNYSVCKKKGDYLRKM